MKCIRKKKGEINLVSKGWLRKRLHRALSMPCYCLRWQWGEREQQKNEKRKDRRATVDECFGAINETGASHPGCTINRADWRRACERYIRRYRSQGRRHSWSGCSRVGCTHLVDWIDDTNERDRRMHPPMALCFLILVQVWRRQELSQTNSRTTEW